MFKKDRPFTLSMLRAVLLNALLVSQQHVACCVMPAVANMSHAAQGAGTYRGTCVRLNPLAGSSAHGGFADAAGALGCFHTSHVERQLACCQMTAAVLEMLHQLWPLSLPPILSLPSLHHPAARDRGIPARALLVHPYRDMITALSRQRFGFHNEHGAMDVLPHTGGLKGLQTSHPLCAMHITQYHSEDYQPATGSAKQGLP